MKSRLTVVVLVFLLGACATAWPQPPASPQPTADDRRIWPEFVALLKSGRIGESHVRPAYVPAATLLGFLENMRQAASWPEWSRVPEVYRVGPLVHFVTRLSEKGIPNTYSFTFVTDGGRWYLQHFEGIVLRLDRVGPLPVTTFPDVPEDRKAWMREETYWSQMVYLFGLMRKAAGVEAAFGMFRDGAGYAVAARTWVPFLPPARAFVLYACWEQSRLRGNAVRLERLGDDTAVIVFDLLYLALYRHTGHLRSQITEDDYRRIFETIWRDRATASGWAPEFSYDGTRCTLTLKRAGETPGPAASIPR